MSDRFPDYDVLAKRDTPSWNAQTRAVIDVRLAEREPDDVLTPEQRATLRVVVDRIVPQPVGRSAINAVALLLGKIGGGDQDGFRHHELPPLAEAWGRGLTLIDAEAVATFDTAFARLTGEQADAVLRAIEAGSVRADWSGLSPKLFWEWRLIPDIVAAYYAHPSAWSAMGFGGPASPRGYVRLQTNRRDPWEAAERDDGGLLPAKIRNRDA